MGKKETGTKVFELRPCSWTESAARMPRRTLEQTFFYPSMCVTSVCFNKGRFFRNPAESSWVRGDKGSIFR
jgi:hypothetical protein